MKYITKTIWVLSVISLLTDVASEMLYPVMPLYLKEIGFSVVLIGILEGVAEATAGLSKGYFGKLSDNTGKRKPFIQIGYTLSAISKTMMAFIAHPLWIFLSRTMDRLGKGIRTGARDAMLSDESTPETKGKVFGFHRSMDTFGAVLGPISALVYLYYFPKDYITLFYISFIPGVFAISISFLIKESSKTIPPENQKRTSFLAFLKYWRTSPIEYRKLSYGLLAFTLFNSSDVFLLLKAKQSGLDDYWVLGVYIFYNLIYALFAFPLGIIADRIGLKKMLLIGLGFFSLAYFTMTFHQNYVTLFLVFFCYGVYSAATEGISKAWISNITDKKDTATAIGTFSGFQSICAMLASSLAGLFWYNLGPASAFLISGIAAILIIIYFLTNVHYSTKNS